MHIWREKRRQHHHDSKALLATRHPPSDQVEALARTHRSKDFQPFCIRLSLRNRLSKRFFYCCGGCNEAMKAESEKVVCFLIAFSAILWPSVFCAPSSSLAGAQNNREACPRDVWTCVRLPPTTPLLTISSTVSSLLLHTYLI